VTVEIALVLAILLMAIGLFVSEWLRMDLVALLVLGSLAALNLVTPLEALSGFSNAAVVTVWAMFIISGGLSKTGVANLLGRQVMRMAGEGEARLVAVIMVTAAVMSAFMNNVGVAAMLLPVVIGIARSTGRAPSRLLMPLAYGSLLGGLTTLIGTPPNILVSDALREYGLQPFRLFDFTPIGGVIMIAGIVFVTFFGRYLLPDRDPVRESAGRGKDLRGDYNLGERLFVLHLPLTTPLAGKTLAQSRLGSALRLNVLAIIRRGQPHLSPRPEVVLQAGDRLLVQGDLAYLSEMRDQRHLVIHEDSLPLEQVIAQEIGVVEARLASDSAFVGQTLYQAHWRSDLGVNVLAIRRQDDVRHTNLQDTALRPHDVLLLQGPRERLEKLADASDFETIEPVAEQELARVYHLDERFLALHVPDDSIWVGKSLLESRIGDAYGFTVLGIVRDGAAHFMPEPDERLEAGDTLMVKGAPEMLDTLAALHGIQELEIETEVPSSWAELESPEVGLAEVVLSPETTLEDKTLRELNFREKYGLTVLAIWRRGTAHRTELRDMALRFGDAILVYGPRQKLRVLGREPDFLVLTEGEQEPPRVEKAPISIAIMIAILLPVFFGLMPISIAAVIGATLMVLSRCLTMEEAYRYIEWPAVFLIAGMLPLGIAMEQTGAALFLADGVISVVGGLGPRAVLAGIYILTALATQIIPTAALVVLMAPIAMNTAADLGLSPLPLMMTMAMAASASFSSPVSHPANVLVMGPGGYRFVDYLKLGLPLTLVVLIIVVLLVPILWPL
jgi:di/tricarboxylate transporter